MSAKRFVVLLSSSLIVWEGSDFTKARAAFANAVDKYGDCDVTLQEQVSGPLFVIDSHKHDVARATTYVVSTEHDDMLCDSFPAAERRMQTAMLEGCQVVYIQARWNGHVSVIRSYVALTRTSDVAPTTID